MMPTDRSAVWNHIGTVCSDARSRYVAIRMIVATSKAYDLSQVQV